MPQVKMGTYDTLNINLNGRQILELVPRHYYPILITSGIVRISAELRLASTFKSSTSEIAITTEPNREYYVKCDILEKKVNLALVEREIGVQEIYSCYILENGPNDDYLRSYQKKYTATGEKKAEIIGSTGKTTDSSSSVASSQSQSSKEKREGLSIISVLDFVVENLPKSNGVMIVDLMSSALVEAGKYRVIDRTQREKIMKEIEFSLGDCTDDACQLEIGRLLAADKIIVGTLGEMGGKYILSVKMLDVETGEVVSSAHSIYTSLGSLVDGCTDLVRKL